VAKAKSAAKAALGNRSQNLWVLGFGLLLVAITVTGLRSVDAAHEMRGLYGRMGEVQREQDGLLEGHSRLMLERGALTSMQSVEEVAGSELGMKFPDQVGQVLE
jgi:cell division protein FtsL